MNDLSNTPPSFEPPSSDDISAAIRSMGTNASAQAVGDIDENPEQGAQALRLSQATGAAPLAVYGDLDGFSSQNKAAMAGGLIGKNPFLQSYISKNPLASVVSNDDWGSLDQLSRGASVTSSLLSRLKGAAPITSGSSITTGIEAPFVGFNQGLADFVGAPIDVVNWAMGKMGLPVSQTPFGGSKSIKNVLGVIGANPDLHPPHSDVERVLQSTGEGAASMMVPESALGGAVTLGLAGVAPWATELLQSFFGASNTIPGLLGNAAIGAASGAAGEGAREVAQQAAPNSPIIQTAADIVGGLAGGIGTAGFAHAAAATASAIQVARRIAQVRDAIKAAEPLVSNGLEVLTGIHPMIDEAKAKVNATMQSHLERDLQTALTTVTRDRSSPLFKNFVEQNFGTKTLGISGDRVAQLYGDREPSPDDGLLGWVPNIADQLDLARSSGVDVQVPIRAWLTHVEPEIAANLHDGIRMWPVGVTADEAQIPIEPKNPIDGALPLIRAASSLEPMYSIGDRKLQLKGAPQVADGIDEYQILDESQQPIGEMTVVPDSEAKQLYVANISGLNGMGPNDFGPALVKDMKRQLKELYPEYETVTGHRVSGAREAAGVDVYAPEAAAHPVVKLNLPPVEDIGSIDPFRQVLNDAWWQKLAPGSDVLANIKPRDLYTEHEDVFERMLQAEKQRLLGNRADLQTAQELRSGDYSPSGLFQEFDYRKPIIATVLQPDALGVLRHEAMHAFRQLGLISPDEWETLRAAATERGWRQKFDIDKRYPKLTEEQKDEEAIAEGFREWATKSDQFKELTTPMGGIFQRLKKFIGNAQQRLKEIFGRQLSPDELFEQALSGRIGRRQGTKPIKSGVFNPSYSMPEDYFDNLRANAAGLDLKSWKMIQADIKARYDEDLEIALKRAQKLQAKQQTKEWKADRVSMRQEVEPQLRGRPDIAADLFLGSGEINGKKLAGRYTLRADDLTPEQQALLPKHYISNRGLPVQDVAHMFGYQTADELVQHLGAYNAAKAGLSPHEMLGKMIDAETDRQMMSRYGNLDENVMSAAQDQALSETNLNLMADEMYAAGIQAKVQPVDKYVAAAEADRQFSKMPIGEVDSGRLMSLMGKHGRDAERALIQGDSAGAFVSLQRKFFSGLLAARARKLEKSIGIFKRIAKRFARREISGVDPEYTAHVQDILSRVGWKLARKPHDIAKDIAATEAKGLEAFVAQKTDMLRELPVWPQLFDSAWQKGFDELTVEEFNAVHGSVQTLYKNGRDERQIEIAGEKMDLNDLKLKLISSLAQLKEKPTDIDDLRSMGPIGGKTARAIRTYGYSHFTPETLFNHWDNKNPYGLWNTLLRDVTDGAYEEEDLRREFSQRLAALGDKIDLAKNIPNSLFRNPRTGAPFTMTRLNLRAVMLNLGTDSNLDVLARGYKIDPNAIEAWVNTHALPEDWTFTRGVWDIFRDIKPRSDTMYRSLSGVAPGSVVERQVPTRDGMIQGGYYPIIHHPGFKGESTKSLNAKSLMDPSYVKAAVPAGYTVARTGYAAPLDLSINALPGRISQMLHDIAMRPGVIETSKIFADRGIQNAISLHAGREVADQLMPYLRDVANSANNMSGPLAQLNGWSEFIRQNTIAMLVGLNPGTVMKHAPTAFVNSIKEVGARNFLRATKMMYATDPITSENGWQFAYKHFAEMRRRDRNWDETLFGATNELQYGDTLPKLRQRIMQWAAKPVAISDMLSAGPTGMAAYWTAKDAGMSEGDAIYAANRAIRRAHGSTLITNRPAIMRNANPWLTSIYTFYNTMLNRQAETIWDAGEAAGLAKSGQRAAAMKLIPAIAAGTFTYAIWPEIVHQLVSPERTSPNEGWAHKAGDDIADSLGSGWVGIRDIVNALAFGEDPQIGLAQTAAEPLADLVKDMQKNAPFTAKNNGKLIQDTMALGGVMFGGPGGFVGHAGRFAYGVNEGTEPEPSGPWGWATGLRYGTLHGHSQTFEGWTKGTPQ